MSANTNPSRSPSLSRDQAKAIGTLAEEMGELDNDLKLAYGETSPASRTLGPELWEIILIYLSGKAMDTATSHFFDSVIDQAIHACQRWFRKQRRVSTQELTRRFAILDEDGRVLRHFEIREDETIVELPKSVRISNAAEGPQSTGGSYAVDTVFVIDVTGNMASEIDAAKERTLSFQDRLVAVMKEMGKAVQSNRVRVVAFNNSIAAAHHTIESTEFLVLPEELPEFQKFVRRLKVTGVGEGTGAVLDALAAAIGSQWGRHTDECRHVVVVFTSATATLVAGARTTRATTYLDGAPLSFEELSKRWGFPGSDEGAMDNAAKRLVLFAPDAWPWNLISENWDNTIFFPSSAGNGLDEWPIKEILAAVAHDV